MPPFPTAPLPTSNCGFTSATTSPGGLMSSRTAGNTSRNEMKETSMTARSAGTGS